jgi:hypothetical protein
MNNHNNKKHINNKHDKKTRRITRGTLLKSGCIEDRKQVYGYDLYGLGVSL